MSRASYVAAAIQYLHEGALDHDAPEDAAELVGLLHDARSVDDICLICLSCIRTPLTTFIALGILDGLLLGPVEALFESQSFVHLSLAVLRGSEARDARHLVCGLVPCIEVVLRDPSAPCLLEVVELLHEMARSPWTDMIRSVRLFRSLASCAAQGTERLLTCALRIVTDGKFYDDVRLVDDLVCHVLRRLSCGNATIDLDTLAAFVRECFDGNPRLRETHVDAMSELWHSGWHPRLGELLAIQLDTPSVEFVVRLECDGKLSHLIRSCAARDLHWRVVRHRLRSQWPARVAQVLNQPLILEEEDENESTITCPITHVAMRHPVIASDGHTYERDALLLHIVRNGCWSPMTRVPLSYHLYPNRLVGEATTLRETRVD